MTAVGVAIAVGLVAAGCAAAGPSADDVADRYVIEYAGRSGISTDVARDRLPTVDAIAAAAIGGSCGDENYRYGLGDDVALVYAWDATCLAYFESDMTADQVDRATQSVYDETLRRRP